MYHIIGVYVGIFVSMNTKVPTLDQCTLSIDNRREITIEKLAPYLERNNDLVFPHRHNFFQFVLFTQGTGTHSIDFQRFDVAVNQIYFMSPGQIHTWELGNDVDGYIVNFEPDTFQTFLLRTDYIVELVFFSGLPNSSVYLLNAHTAQIIQQVLDQAILMKSKVDFVRSSLLYVMVLVSSQIQQDEVTGQSTYHFTLLNNFRSLIEKHYTSKRLPKDYASMLYITPNHLNALSKEYLGIPAGEVIRNRILLEAKRLLVIRSHSISEIAYALNFNDNSYFTKFFKKIEGITPEEFRKIYIR